MIRYKKFVVCGSKKSTFLKEIKKKNWAFQFFTKNVFELIKACKRIAQATKKHSDNICPRKLIIISKEVKGKSR